MTRRILTDGIWAQLQSVMAARGCYDAKNSREVIEAILWKLRTGAPWRDIRKEFCSWETAYGRFNNWAAKGLWTGFF
jgi:transposase